MKLTALRLHNVRRFGGRGVAVEDIGAGVNVLCAANEYGKSTCFDALHALFFQPHTGTPNAVRALRPYSGGSPLVEADITTADGAFRVTKQFYGGKRAMVRELRSGRLVAQADEAERFIGGLVQGGTAGPAGLLWVRQGVIGIERGKGDEDEKVARETVLTSVQGEVESLTGGRRMAQAVAACDAELSKLLTTTGRAKAGGPYDQALKERDRLLAQEASLKADVEGLRAALDRRTNLRKRLAELENPDQQAQRQRDVVQAEAAFAAAKAHGEALKTAEVEAALAGNRRDSARQAVERYRADLARFEILHDQAAERSRSRDAALAHQRDVAAAGQGAAAAVDAAEREERETRDLLTRLDKALQARAAAEHLAGQKEAYAKAEAGRAEVEAIEAELKVLALPPQALQQLEAQEAELAHLRAVIAARVPVLRIDYAAGVAGRIAIAGTALADGAEQPLTATTTLDIAGIGRLTLTLPPGRYGQEDLAGGEAKRDALLARLGVDSLDAARQRDGAARDLANKLDLARQRLSLLAPKGLAVLQETIARLEAQSQGESELKGDPEAVRGALVQAEAGVMQARHAAREAHAQHTATTDQVVEAERALATITSDLRALDSALGPKEERADRLNALAAAFAEAEEVFMAAQAKVATLRAGAPDLPAAEAKMQRMRSIRTATASEVAKLREEAAELAGQIRTRSDAAVEEAWQEAADKLAAAQARVARLEREVALLTRLSAALTAARGEARDHYFAPVMGELRPLLGLLFEDAAVTFDEATLLPSTVRRNGVEEPVGVLSGGMREQLAVLTRLAFARLLARDGEPAPVILDDALVYSDDDRIERMFDALHRQASNQQIIVFSCRQRAFAQLGGNVLRMTPWTPEP